jgi:hypothetical protein
MADKGCKEITEGYELVVVECLRCRFHLGVDLSYLEEIGKAKTKCPGCGNPLIIEEAE